MGGFTVFSSKRTTSLNISHDTRAKSITNCAVLSVLALNDTFVRKISNCPALHSLTVSDNGVMRSVKSFSVSTVSLEACTALKSIHLPRASTLYIKNTPEINDVYAPHAATVTIEQFRARWLSFCLNRAFTRLHSLTLIDVQGLHLGKLLVGSSVKRITLRSCDIKTIDGLPPDLESLEVEECHALQMLTNVHVTNRLSVSACDGLNELLGGSAESIVLTRCNSLTIVAGVLAGSINISYCFGLSTLPRLNAQSIRLSRCPMLSAVGMSSYTTEFVLEHCFSFESVDFRPHRMPPFCHAKLSIELIGNNNVTHISDWYAEKLIVRDCSTVETIGSVYSLDTLQVKNCHELAFLFNLYILETLIVDSCSHLESVREVYGVKVLQVKDCSVLYELDFPLSNLEHVTIAGCLDLNLSLDGSLLHHLLLQDCGIVLVRNLPSSCSSVCVRNVELIPDGSNAAELASHTNRLLAAGQLIAKRLLGFKVRSQFVRFLRLKTEDRISNCVICTEKLWAAQTVITPCDHVFHPQCLSSWLRVRRACPLCNEVI